MTKHLTGAQRRNYRTRNKLTLINRAGRPRLSVHRSNSQIYAQVIDDLQGITLASASTVETEMKEKLKSKKGATSTAATEVGKLLAERAKKAGVEEVQFDRGRFLYHGRIKALADGAREGGLKF